ncbi:sugar ABC transporter substrate-binding protein [Streptomyces sp. NBC_01498]|uniref:sugar ABC transporter substrate-binding protein n=1 Tax=Streptomyces sp. NBC_01498 TaxID=2975870 RepID=UPI002E7C028B|nr:sugar ABC transporter substrate-binding protein [Streptomyces sp. NBC_01498]WTL25339.1 sugar ABC transporter substrate-binding protein [Streptomyces sp. NBC_01498]
MKRRTTVAMTLAMSTLTAALAGCGAEPAGGAGGDAKTVGLIRFSGSDVYANSALDAIAAAGKSKGWKVTEVDANGSVDAANTALTNLATKGVDAIAISVFPTEALASGVASARSAGIPVANWGGGLGTGVPIAADVSIGGPMAQRVVDDLGGEGALLALGYRPGLPCQRREKALEEAVAKTDITVDAQQITIPGQVESADKATQAWAQAHPKGGKLAVWACFDDPATGAAAALQQLGRTDVKAYGLNGTAEALSLVKAGKLTATEWIDGPSQGREIAELLEKFWAAPDDFEPVEIDGDYKIVDKSNVDDFLAEHPELRK